MLSSPTPGSLNEVYNQLTEVQHRLSIAESESARLARELERAHSAHQAFKEKVRETAIRVAEEQSWCRPGLNAELRGLGLEPLRHRYVVHVELNAVQHVDVTVEATDEDDAYHQVDRDPSLAERLMDRSAWEYAGQDLGDVDEG